MGQWRSPLFWRRRPLASRGLCCLLPAHEPSRNDREQENDGDNVEAVLIGEELRLGNQHALQKSHGARVNSGWQPLSERIAPMRIENGKPIQSLNSRLVCRRERLGKSVSVKDRAPVDEDGQKIYAERAAELPHEIE